MLHVLAFIMSKVETLILRVKLVFRMDLILITNESNPCLFLKNSAPSDFYSPAVSLAEFDRLVASMQFITIPQTLPIDSQY